MSALVVGAAELGISLSPRHIEDFAKLQGLLLEWNQRINLTSITEPADVQVKHFLDSLTVLFGLPTTIGRGEEAGSLLDVGAGAGFPGLPLAIVLPSLRVTLLEATQKKCRFLEAVIGALGLTNARVACGRAEELAHRPRDRESYDVAVARGVASLATLAELCLPFVVLGGRVVASKKLGIDAETRAARRAIQILGGRLAPSVLVRLPILNEERQLIVVDKIKATPAAYPRRSGMPAKSPLG